MDEEVIAGPMRAAEVPRSREKSFRLLFRDYPHPMFVYDTVTLSILEVNDAALFQYGYSRGEFLGMGAHEIYPPADRPRLLDLLLRTTRPSHVRVTGPWRHLRKDGTLIDVEVASHPTDFEERPAAVAVAFDITERKRAEDALRASEERYRRIVETAQEGIWVLDADHRTTFVNRKMADLLGYSGDEMIGRSVFDFVAPEIISTTQVALERRRRGVADVHETQYRRKDGTILWASLATNPIFDQGRYIGALALVTDVTEKVRAERDAEAARDRLQHLMNSLDEVVFVHDLANGAFDISASCQRVFGYSREEFAADPDLWLTRVHPDDLPAAVASRTLLAKGEVVELETRLRQADGEVTWLAARIKPTLDPAGQLVRIEGILMDVTGRKRAEEALRISNAMLLHRAFHDPLTGLPNRALFLERLDDALDRAYHGGVAVLFLDLDRFKIVNASFGHEVGDGLLVEVARRLEGTLGQIDLLARFGGDEFAVLLPDERSDLQDPIRVAERLGAVLAEPFDFRGREVVTATSIGIATNTSSSTAIELVRNADLALYRAKARGRGRYEVFDAAMGAQAIERLELEAELRQALERGEFVVYYQPKVDLLSGALVGMEALVRWHHPRRGLVPPLAFIGLAEESGLIRPLGQWVLEEACRQTREWRERMPGATLITSVNLSARQFGHPTLVRDVARALATSGVDPEAIQLEITESVAMEDAESTIATLRSLKELGVGLAIDDFGTGYSSLAYLKRFPVDALKIDRAFIRGLTQDENDAAIVTAIVRVAETLGLSVVAEGVETAEQARCLVGLGCRIGQGYLYAPPQAPDLVERWLREATRPARMAPR